MSDKSLGQVAFGAYETSKKPTFIAEGVWKVLPLEIRADWQAAAEAVAAEVGKRCNDIGVHQMAQECQEHMCNCEDFDDE